MSGLEVRSAAADSAAYTGRSTEFAEDLPKGSRPLPCGSPGMGEGDRGLHDVGVGTVVLGHPPQSIDGPAHHGLVAVVTPALDIGDLCRLDPMVDLQDVLNVAHGRERRGCRLGEAVHSDDALFTRLDPTHPLGLASHQTRLQFVNGGEGSSERFDLMQFGHGRPR